MNWKTAFFAVLALWLAMLAWQCGEGEAPATASSEATATTDAEALPPCSAAADTIGAAKARKWIADYQQFKKRDPQAWQDSVLNLRGFALTHPCEIRDMALALGERSVVQLELGLNDAGEIDIIFRGRGLAKPFETTGDGQGWTYFDFTEPCPPGCEHDQVQ